MKQNALQDTRWRLFISKVCVYLPLVNQNVSQIKSKGKQVQGSLWSFFEGKQSTDDKEINTASETPALTKKNTQVPGGMEG